MQTLSTHPTLAGNRDDVEYSAYLVRIVNRFFTLTASGKTPLFTTDAANNSSSVPFFSSVYLDTFVDPVERQHHNCNACRHFIEKYGTLAIIDESGVPRSAIWSLLDIPGPYTPFVVNMMAAVENAKITGVFVTDQEYLGEPSLGRNDDWTHFHVRVPEAIRHTSRIQTPYQLMAEKKEDYKNMEEALRRYTPAIIGRAMAVLESDTLYRSEKVLGQATFLETVQQTRAASLNPRVRANMLWLAVAQAPAGFCHPRSSMVGTLLDDLADGMEFAAVKRRFDDKMSPLKYQRPQAAPTVGNLAAAEKIFEKLGLARSLERRYARVEGMTALWRPTAKAQPASPAGVFAHLHPQAAIIKDMATNENERITFARFRDNILPRAERIEALVTHSHNQSFVGVVTAVHADAPPILQWDDEQQRNPMSWFVMHNGSSPIDWSLTPGEWVEVSAVSLNPSMLGKQSAHFRTGAILSLVGAVSRLTVGNALFPECMRKELREIRSTIEAYSKTAVIAGAKEATANGFMIGEKVVSPISVRVTSKGVVSTYTVDRWN